MRILPLITVALAAAALAASAASAKSFGFVKTQNGKIYCQWSSGVRAGVECGIKNGHLKPRPTKKCRIGDPTGGWLAVNTRGKSSLVPCSGDAGPFADPAHTKVVKAGKSFKAGSITCTTTTSTVTCRNKSKHGFTITTPGPYQRF